jgi:small subunit ribosomal protein S20
VAFLRDAAFSLQEEKLRKNKSAIKRTQQAEKRRLRNSHVKSTMKTNIKKALSALGQKDTAAVESSTKAAIAYVDKAASKGVIHRNQAARRISDSQRRRTRSLRAQPDNNVTTAMPESGRALARPFLLLYLSCLSCKRKLTAGHRVVKTISGWPTVESETSARYGRQFVEELPFC